MQEWQLARQEAHKQVLAEHAMQANTGAGFTLHAPVGSHLFLISAKSPHQLRDSHKNWLIIHSSLFILLCVMYNQLA